MTSPPGFDSWTALGDSELTVEHIETRLKPIQGDDLWVAAASFDRLVEGIAVQRALLELGIARTVGALERAREAYMFPTSPAALEETLGKRLGQEPKQKADKPVDALTSHFRAVQADAQLCQMRDVMLSRLDRLNTFVEICEGFSEENGERKDEDDEWEDDPWMEGRVEPLTKQFPIPLPAFLSDDLLHTSCFLASLHYFAALRVLFDRHGRELWPFRFTILKSIPQHAHPSLYRDLLPGFDLSTQRERIPTFTPWRPDADWSQSEEVSKAASLSGAAFLDLTPAYGHLSVHNPCTALELTRWYAERVDDIILSAGLIDVALSTIQHGASQGVPGLDELGEELSLLSRLVYDSPQWDGSFVLEEWTIARWRTMDPPAVIRAYLAHSTPETIARDITKLVVPYLFVLESHAERRNQPDPALFTRLLYNYILTAPLAMAAAIFEASKPTLPAAQRLIRNDEDMARLALACLYGSDSLDEWGTMSRIFECLPAWSIACDDDSDQDVTNTLTSLGTPSTSHPPCTPSDLFAFFRPLPLRSLSRALDILDVHLEAGEIMSRWSVSAPLRWFLQSSGDVGEQRAWATRMARRAGGVTDELKTQEDWEWLLDDMIKLSATAETGCKGVFGLLTRDEVACTFLGGLLSSGKFVIAKAILHPAHHQQSKLALDSNTIEEICISCSREFYDNASSGNYKIGDMKLAYQCLEVPLPSLRIVREKDFIEATSRLSSFNITSRPGVPISPIEIRLTKDRLSLVSRVLSCNAEAYKHTQVILDLVHKLGLDGVVAEVKTSAMLADTALQAEDFARAYESTERMVASVLELRTDATSAGNSKVREASEVCWVACFQLGRQAEFDDVPKKMLLLGRALELCPPNQLHDVLAAWRKLVTEDNEERRESLASRQSGAPSKKSTSNDPAPSLASRLQNMHISASPLAHTPELASRAFSRVAAHLPFSVRPRSRERQSSEDARSGMSPRLDGDVATRVFQKGIGWLIGADDDT